eukprot:451004-Rhodomonas_salina.1
MPHSLSVKQTEPNTLTHTGNANTSHHAQPTAQSTRLRAAPQKAVGTRRRGGVPKFKTPIAMLIQVLAGSHSVHTDPHEKDRDASRHCDHLALLPAGPIEDPANVAPVVERFQAEAPSSPSGACEVGPPKAVLSWVAGQERVPLIASLVAPEALAASVAPVPWKWMRGVVAARALPSRDTRPTGRARPVAAVVPDHAETLGLVDAGRRCAAHSVERARVARIAAGLVGVPNLAARAGDRAWERGEGPERTRFAELRNLAGASRTRHALGGRTGEHEAFGTRRLGCCPRRSSARPVWRLRPVLQQRLHPACIGPPLPCHLQRQRRGPVSPQRRPQVHDQQALA